MTDLGNHRVGWDEAPLTIRISGPGWRAELAVRPPVADSWREAEFPVMSAGSPGSTPRAIVAAVRYTTATTVRFTTSDDQPGGDRRWHVKVYRCANAGDTERLRQHLHRQANDIQRANAGLRGASQIQVDPPWAVVPVHIVRCDGVEEAVGPVRTELAAATGSVISRIRRVLPSWLDDEPPTPELYLLAISPLVDPLRWDGHRGVPGTEQLADFAGMAHGLDTLHQGGTVHCDIKPDNVMRYSSARLSGYVLIDTDAATQVNPPPPTLRTTQKYEHQAITRWRTGTGRRRGLQPAALLAHDRFGFAVIVLTALAGRDWVEQVLLCPVDGEPSGRRVADDRASVAAHLRQLWADSSDRRWAPLIEALAAAFGPEIEDPRWSAERWLYQLQAAERHCVVRTADARPRPAGAVDGYREELSRIRIDALSVPARRPDLIHRGFQAVEAAALRVAVRSATRVLLIWSAGLAAVSAVVVISALGLGR